MRSSLSCSVVSARISIRIDFPREPVFARGEGVLTEHSARKPDGLPLVEITIRREKSMKLDGNDPVLDGVLHKLGASL